MASQRATVQITTHVATSHLNTYIWGSTSMVESDSGLKCEEYHLLGYNTMQSDRNSLD